MSLALLSFHLFPYIDWYIALLSDKCILQLGWKLSPDVLGCENMILVTLLSRLGILGAYVEILK